MNRADAKIPGEMQPHVWWRTAAAVCAILGCALPVAARLAAGPQGADVHVEWRPSVDEPTRERLAVLYHLENPRKLSDTYTWRYDLVDLSRDNIRALVNDPAIGDTHEIDREGYTLAPTAPRTARRQRIGEWGDTIVGIADALAVELLVLAGFALAMRTSIPQLLRRSIPELDAPTAGLFRIVFGTAVLIFFASHPVDTSWLADTFDLAIDGQSAAVVGWLRGHPWVVTLLTPWLLLTGVGFTAGLFTRVTFPLFVAGVLVWAYVATSISITSIHPYGSFVLSLVALLPSAWGDAFSVDAWLRRKRGQASAAQPAGWRYGYSVWVPGLVVGVAYAAAAWAKLNVPPGWTDWVLNGTVKYHFIGDSVNAPVDWGLQFARFPFAAILASFGVVAIEGGLVTAAFVRNEWYRLTLGVAALLLFSGFYLFMGVFWPAWWILLLSFLPWRRLGMYLTTTSRRSTEYASTPRRDLLSAAQLVVIIVVVAQQLVSSSLRLERAPMFSWYDMYSGTFASPEAWSASRRPLYRVVVSTDRGPAELNACDPYAEFVRQFEAALDGSAEARTTVWRALGACGENLSGVHDVTLVGDVRTFDWDRLTLNVSRSAVTLGPLRADETRRPRNDP